MQMTLPALQVRACTSYNAATIKTPGRWPIRGNAEKRGAPLEHIDLHVLRLAPDVQHQSEVQRQASSRDKRRKKRLSNAPAALAAQYDPHITSRQNFKALGLIKEVGLHQPSRAPTPRERLVEPLDVGIPSGFAHVIRDESGAIVEMQEADVGRARAPVVHTPWGAPFEIESTDDETLSDARIGPDAAISDAEPVQSTAVQRLQTAALQKANDSRQRSVSVTEERWLLILFAKYERDVDGMAKDRLNRLQRTPGQIHRLIRQIGGFDALERLSQVDT